MQADIVEGAHTAVILSRHKVRPPGIFIDDIVADLGQILLARGELPDIGPHFFDFERGEIGTGVARRRQRFGAAILVAFAQKEIRHRPRIGHHQVGPADTGRTRRAGR